MEQLFNQFIEAAKKNRKGFNRLKKEELFFTE